jgi:hypothetical protein
VTFLLLAAPAAHAQIWVAPRRPGQSVFRNTKQDWQTTDLLVDEVLNEADAGGIRLFWYTTEQNTAERARAQLERSYRELAVHFDYTPRRRFDYVLYGTYQEFLKTNLFPLQEGILGVTSTRGLEMTIPYFGDHATFEHTSTHEMAHEFSIQKVRDAAKAYRTTRDPLEAFPLWFIEGIAEHAALGPIQGESAMRVRDLVTNPDLYTGHGLLGFWDDYPGYTLWTYAGGHSRITFLAEACGPDIVNDLLARSPEMITDTTVLPTISTFQRHVKKLCGVEPDVLAARYDAWVKRDAYADWLDSGQTLADFEVLKVGGYPLSLDASPDGGLVAVRSISRESGRTAIHLTDPRAPGTSRRVVADNRPGAESIHPIDPRNFDLGADRIAYVAESRGRDVLHVRRFEVDAEHQTGPYPGESLEEDRDGFLFATDRPAREPWWRVRIHLRAHDRYRLGREGLLAVGAVAVEPGGDRVVVSALHEDGQKDLFLVTPAGRGAAVRRLTADVPAERDVAWGPQGVVFASDDSVDGQHHLFLLDPDTDAPPRRLTTIDHDHLAFTVLGDGTVVYSAYDDRDRVQLYSRSPEGDVVRLTDVAVGAFDPAPGPDGAVWALLQDHGRLQPAKLPAPRQQSTPDDHPPAAAGPTSGLPRLSLQDHVAYDPLDPRNWSMDGGFAAIGAGPGGVFGQMYLSFSDRLRDRGVIVAANAYGRPELTDVQVLFVDQHGRFTWGAGPFQALRFRLDRTLDAPLRFQSGERFYGAHGSLRLPLDRYVYLQADASVGGVSYFLFDDTAVFLADPLQNGRGESLLDEWFAANTDPRLQLESGFRFGLDTTRFHPTTGPVAGFTFLADVNGGVQPLDAQQYGALRLDAQGFVPIPKISGGNVSVEGSVATSGGGDYAMGYWLSSYDTLRAFLWGDPALLGRHYWFASSELQVPLDAVVRLALASSVEGVVGVDVGGVADDLDELWDRRVLDVALGSNFVLGPLVLRLHFARAIDVGAPLPQTPNPWVTNFSLSWLGQ